MNFGERSFDCSDAEKMCNIIVYIIGEEILSSCPFYVDLDEYIDEELAQAIISEIKQIYKL